MTDDVRTTRAAKQLVEAVNSATDKAATREASPPPEPKGKGKWYTSTAPTTAGGGYSKPGDPFFTNAAKSEEWTEHTPKEVVAIDAATNPIPDDAQFDAASVEALQAYALVKHVAIVGIEKDRKALITAIKAANEPKL